MHPAIIIVTVRSLWTWTWGRYVFLVAACKHRLCARLLSIAINIHLLVPYIEQDAQLSQRDRAAGCVIVLAKSRTLELGDNDLWTL